MTQKHIKIICYISIILFIVLKFIGIDIFDALGYAVSGATVLGIAYDRWAWQYNPFEKTPRIAGVYDAWHHSSHEGGFDYHSTITIYQTLSSVTVREELDYHGYCESIAATLTAPTDHRIGKLYYTYRSYHDLTGLDKLYEGTAVLRIVKTDKLSGYYFTDRVIQTSGKLTLIRRTD